jgi:hypothetical protein
MLVAALHCIVCGLEKVDYAVLAICIQTKGKQYMSF